jgi:hypothetical protein
VPEPLRILSQLLESPGGVLTSDDLHAFGANAREALVATRVLVAARTATHVTCDQCHDGHVEEVSRVALPGGGTRFLVNCPEAGLVEVNPERLRQWKVDVDRLASLLAGGVGAGNVPEPLVRGTAWRLGQITVAGTAFNVVLLVPTATVDGPPALPNSIPPERTVLVVTSEGETSLDGFAGVLPLASAFRFGGAGCELAMDRVRPSMRIASGMAPNAFRLRGQVWELTFEQQTVLMKDGRGLAYIARLLAEPMRDIPAVCLMADRVGIDPQIAGGSKGEVLDDQARKAYEERYRDLAEDLTEAEADKVRKSVSMAVTRAIESIRAEHESLGNHLSAFISMGLVFRYAPDPPIEWLT